MARYEEDEQVPGMAEESKKPELVEPKVQVITQEELVNHQLNTIIGSQNTIIENQKTILDLMNK